MSILSLFRKPQEVTNQISTTPVYFGNQTNAGESVTKKNAMQTSTVFACVRVVSEAIGSLPLKLYQHDGNSMTPDLEHPLYDILHLCPNDEMTSLDLRETMCVHLLLYGNSYSQIIRNGLGQVTAIYPLMPQKVEVNRNNNGEIFYTYRKDYDERYPKKDAESVNLSKHEVLHIHGLSFDGLVGYSPIELARQSIGLAKATENYGSTFFRNNATPGGILEHPSNLGTDGVEQIKKSFNKVYKGTKNSHQLSVLEEGMKYKQVSIPPDSAQFLETRKFQRSEIASWFNVPPHMIGDLEHATFSNIEHQSIQFVKTTLTPWVTRIEQAMNVRLLSPSERKKYIIKFNLDGLLRGDYKTRMEGYAKGRQNGWYSSNDIRRLEDMPLLPPEIGDVYLVNGNMISIPDAAAGIAYDKLKHQVEEDSDDE